MKSSKIWGTTQLLHKTPTTELHWIEAKAGYQCSRHKHRIKHNLFAVHTGRLMIQVWREGLAVPEETILGPGEAMVVEPGLVHRFLCVEDCSATEYYFCEIPGEDIERLDQGGKA